MAVCEADTDEGACWQRAGAGEGTLAELSAALSRRLERGDTEVGAGCHPGGPDPPSL